MRALYLIRHGETEFNRDGRIQGDTESTLSPRGVEQAGALGRRLLEVRLEAAYSSPLQRALDTCRIALDGRVPWTVRPDLREVHMGVWEGRSGVELREAYPVDVERWFARPTAARIEGGELVAAFRDRVVAEMKRIREAHPDAEVAVFAHGGVICVYLATLLGMSLDRIWGFKVRNASITRVVFPGDRARVDLFGDVAHLGEL